MHGEGRRRSTHRREQAQLLRRRAARLCIHAVCTRGLGHGVKQLVSGSAPPELLCRVVDLAFRSLGRGRCCGAVFGVAQLATGSRALGLALAFSCKAHCLGSLVAEVLRLRVVLAHEVRIVVLMVDERVVVFRALLFVLRCVLVARLVS